MTKKELKKILQMYSKISTAVEQRQTNAVINLYGRNKVILIPRWSYLLKDFINSIISNEEDPYFIFIIKQNYLKGKKDKEILTDIPITESSYYRLKRKFEERIYELYIVSGYVTMEEIMKNKIVD